MKRSGTTTVLTVLVAFIWIFFSGGGPGPADVEANEAAKVAFIYVGPIGDLGWSWEHDRGRKMLEAKFGDKVKTAYIESVPEGPDAASRGIRRSLRPPSGTWTRCWRLHEISRVSISSTAQVTKPPPT